MRLPSARRSCFKARMISVSIANRLDDFSLDIAFESDARVVALFGASGAGKSMTIGSIAGLVRPDRARIVLDDRVLTDTTERIVVSRHRRRVGLVFQDAQLFPHLSVRQNLDYGKWFAPKAEDGLAFDQVVATLGIDHLLARRPATLSGGERQRVAIGRALLSQPKLLLMDEPLSALDAATKDEILPFLQRLRDSLRLPVIYVSHDRREIERLAEHLLLMQSGHVEAAAGLGAPTDAPSR